MGLLSSFILWPRPTFWSRHTAMYVATDCKHGPKNPKHCRFCRYFNCLQMNQNNAFCGTVFVLITFMCHTWLKRANSLAFLTLIFIFVGPSGRAVWRVGLRPLASWDCGFESHRGHGCLSVVSVVCCHVEVSASSWSLVQRSPTECGASLFVIYRVFNLKVDR